MKQLLNNMSFEERQNIREQHTGGMKVMSDSFRRLVNGKLGNLKPLISEQTEALTSAGFNKVTEINLPDGAYMGNPPSYATLAQSLNLYNVHYIFLYTKNSWDPKFTGYILNINSASRSGYDNVEITITGKKSSTGDEYWFKESGYQPTEQKVVSSKLSEGIQNVLPQMIQSPPFEGYYSSSTFAGTFNGVDYEWVANGVEGMSGIRGISYGVVLTENNSYLVQKGITDADPSGTWVGFADDNGRIKFACYKTTGGTIKCTNNSEI